MTRNAFTPREDAALLALKTSRDGRVENGQLPELAIMFGRTKAVLINRRRYLLGRIKRNPGPLARRRAAEAAQGAVSG